MINPNCEDAAAAAHYFLREGKRRIDSEFETGFAKCTPMLLSAFMITAAICSSSSDVAQQLSADGTGLTNSIRDGCDWIREAIYRSS